MNVLDGGWTQQDPLITVTLPMPEEMFSDDPERRDAIADLISGTFARRAREEYLRMADSRVPSEQMEMPDA